MTKQDDLTKKVEAYYTQAKPPFDPLNAGWVMCACRCHQSEFVRGHRHDECPTCEGLGIVVAPPRDGMSVSYFLERRKTWGKREWRAYTMAYWAK
jgi:hypothetical protein